MSTDATSPGTTLRLPSSLRIADVAEFRPQCDLALEGDGVLDCDAEGVEFIDAAGLQLLVALSRACTQRARRFEIRAPSGAFASAARIGGFAPLLGLPAA